MLSPVSCAICVHGSPWDDAAQGGAGRWSAAGAVTMSDRFTYQEMLRTLGALLARRAAVDGGGTASGRGAAARGPGAPPPAGPGAATLGAHPAGVGGAARHALGLPLRLDAPPGRRAGARRRL